MVHTEYGTTRSNLAYVCSLLEWHRAVQAERESGLMTVCGRLEDDRSIFERIFDVASGATRTKRLKWALKLLAACGVCTSLP